MPTRSVLITGGAGFIGRWLVKRCLDAGDRVTAVDNLAVGCRDNLAEFDGRLELIDADVTDGQAVRAALAAAGPHVVFHLAAHHYIPWCNEHPIQTLRVNGEGTFTVLRAAADAGVEMAVATSSGVLYPPLDRPLREDDELVIGDVYALSKKITEDVCEFIVSTTPMRCAVARLFNTYGPYETNPHLIPHIVRSIRDRDHVELGNLEPKRDYIYVEDVADALWRLSHAGEKGAERGAERHTVVNVGTGEEHSVREVVEAIARAAGREIDIRQDPARVRATDKLHQRADLTRLRTLIPAFTSRSIEEGLAALVRHEAVLVRHETVLAG